MIIKKSLVKSLTTIPSLIILTSLFLSACVNLNQQTKEPLSPTPIIIPTQTPYTSNEIIIAQEQLLTSIYQNTIPSSVPPANICLVSEREYISDGYPILK